MRTDDEMAYPGVWNSLINWESVQFLDAERRDGGVGYTECWMGGRLGWVGLGWLWRKRGRRFTFSKLGGERRGEWPGGAGSVSGDLI